MQKIRFGKTVAVIASGFNNIYPPENKLLFKQIIEEGGCIISEYPPETKIDMHRFPRRNRIISGLSNLTLVVEAKYRSGSSITARYAKEQGRLVCAIPGNIDMVRSTGCNMLIKEGAYPVISPRDIIHLLEFEGCMEINKIKVRPEYEDVYRIVNMIPKSVDEIAKIAERRINEVSEILFMLEIDGFIKSVDLGKYVLQESEEDV